MSKTLTASDRKSLIRLASSLPAGSPERRAILAGLQKGAALLGPRGEDLESLDHRYDQRTAVRLADAFSFALGRGIGNIPMSGDILTQSKRELISIDAVGDDPKDPTHAVWLTIEPWTNGSRYTVAVRGLEPGTRGRVRRWEKTWKVFEAGKVLGSLAALVAKEIRDDIQQES